MASRNGRAPAPSEFPPPVDPVHEFIKRELDAEEERIEVGVAIVGGGTAGLACANRLLQLLADDPETMEKLGEVPVAVIEKAKTCGGHNLSGAVMRPGPLEELFPELTREDWRKERFAFGEVTKESVYMLPGPRRSSGCRFRRSELQEPRQRGGLGFGAGPLPAAPGRGCRRLRPHRDERRPATGRWWSGRRGPLGDKGRGKDGEPLGNFEPGSDVTARVTVLAEGCWGHLTGAAIKEFGLAENREPQVWELGVKEVWKVKKPLDRVIHTFVQPWPLKVAAKYGQLGGTWIYPMKDEKTGDDLVSIGFVVDLNYRDATTSAHDLLQAFKTHPLVKDILDGGERVAWGAKALPGGGYWSMPKLSMPGARARRRRGGMVDTAALKGVHHCIKSGILAAEAIYPSEDRTIARVLRGGRGAVLDRQGALPGAQHAPGVPEGLRRRQPARRSGDHVEGQGPPGRQQWHRDDAEPMFVGDTKDRYPKPDGKYTFDKLSSVYMSGNATRDDAPNHIRVRKNVPREIAETWQYMCPAGVYEIPDDAPDSGNVDVIVNYTNCVQCGAITAKGGRLTPPEGGDGPLYTVT